MLRKHLGSSAIVIVAMCLLVLSNCASEKTDLSGEWKVKVTKGSEELRMSLAHDRSTVTGSVEADGERYQIENGHFEKGRLAFTYLIEGEGEVEFSFVLQADGSLNGTVKAEGEQVDVSGHRVPLP